MERDVGMESGGLPSRPRVGISRCLLGEPVRYDGGHKHNQVVAEELGRHFHWVPVCPEVECGLGIPREPLQLFGPRTAPRLITSHSNRDITDMMVKCADAHIRGLLKTGIHGFILKARSPSCGVDNVPLHGAQDRSDNGRGLFASAVIAQCPSLPIEDEARLQHRDMRRQFIERVAKYHREHVK